MLITAKFNGRCANCGKPTPAGSEIAYIDRKAYHPPCAPSEEGFALTNEPGAKDEALALAHRLKFSDEKEDYCGYPECSEHHRRTGSDQ